MGDKFLGSGAGNILNLSNGTTTLFGSTIGALNLDASQPIKTNSVRQLVSSKLDISDINNLQNELNNTLADPIILKEKVQPSNPAINTKAIYASSVDGEIHFLDENGVDKIFSTSTTPFLPLGGGTMTGNLDMGNQQILNTSIAGGIGLEVQTNKDNINILQTDLTTETTNRTNADTNLQNQITTNDTDISLLQTDLTTETTNRTNADTNLQNQITTNDTDILNLQTDLGTEITNRTNADTTLQNQITSNDTDILTLTPQKIDINQNDFVADTTKWDATNKSANIVITGGTIDRPSATTLDYIHSTLYSLDQDIDFEFKINSISGPNLFVSLCDINTQGNVSVGTFETACSEVVSVVLSTTSSTLSIRYKPFGGVVSTITYFIGTILSANDVVKFSLRGGVVELFLNSVPLNDGTTFFNNLNFELTQNYYVRFSDASVNNSSFNITLQESLTPLQSIDNRDTLYELKYNPETDISLPVPLRIGQKLTFFNNQTDEQYFGLAGSDIENGNVRKIISDNTGNLYLAGSFTLVNGVAINRFVRYNIPTKTYFACDGGIDDGEVFDMVLAEDNLIILVGTFTAYNGGNSIARGGRILRYDIPSNTFNEAIGGADGTIFGIEKDPVLKYVWLVGSFLNVNNNTLANRIVQYNYSNDSYITVNNTTTASVGLPSGTLRDIKITQDRTTVYLAGGFNLNNLQGGNNNSAKYDLTTETFSSLGIFNQGTQHLELYENTLYISGEAVTQITQNNGIIKSIREVARYDYRTDEWHQIVSDNFATEDAANQISEVDVLYALPNGGILLGGFFVNKFMYLSPFGRQNIGSGFTVSTGQVLTIVYDDYSKCLYLGGSMINTNSGNSFNRVLKIPICNTLKYNFDKNANLLLGDQKTIQARDLNNWI